MRFHAALVLLISLAAANGAGITIPGVPTIPLPGGGAPPAGGTGDPIMTGFDGRKFEFFGKAGNIYNVLSEKHHQLSMKLKEGHMWDHEGSYMSGVGLKYRNHTVVIANEGDALEVTLDDVKLVLKEGESELEHILGLAEGELELLWQLHRPGFGNAIEITTDVLNVIIWVTPAGTRDEGGKVQPAYLNFDISLLASPAHNALEGIIGQTFSTKAVKAEENDFKFHGDEAAFEMASYFDAAHPKCLFGKTARVSGIRKLMETGSFVILPMKASLK